MAFWRKHRFVNLKKEDDTDKVIGGSQFVVKYIGSADTCEENIPQDAFPDAEDVWSSFYEHLLTTLPSGPILGPHYAPFRMLVDLSGASIYDNQETCVQRFQLSDIKDVCHSCNPNHNKHFILIGREESSAYVKAYLYSCASKERASEMYKVFTQTFTIGATMNNNNNNNNSSSGLGSAEQGCVTRKRLSVPVDSSPTNPNETVSEPRNIDHKNGISYNYNLKSYPCKNEQTYIMDKQTACQGSDDCFTTFAKFRSRSTSSNEASSPTSPVFQLEWDKI